MRDAYRSLLTALGAVLALWLILGFWALSTGSRVVLSLLVVVVSGLMLWRQRQASQARATAVREIVDENLPPEDFQGAVILACGDNAPLFASGFHHRETRQGWYRKTPAPVKPRRLPVTAMPRSSGGFRPVRIC